MQSRRFSGNLLIYLIFFFSGMSALMYEITWMKNLNLIMGNTVQSSTTVLAAFMAGLALGSFLFGRVVDRSLMSPLRFYAYLELGIAFFAFVFPFLIQKFQSLYISFHHFFGLSLLVFTAVRFIVSFLLLLMPTLLMGATLPVLSKYIEEGYDSIGRKIGLLYAVNTLGAVVGVLFTGYLLLGLSGITITTNSAIMINLLVALLALLLDMKRKKKGFLEPLLPDGLNPDICSAVADDGMEKNIKWIAIAAFFLSGFTALGYEVLWMRVFIPFLHSSTYSFATMLAAFLTGLAVGSWIFSYFVDRWKSLIGALGWTQVLIGGLTLASLFSFLLYYRSFSPYLDLALEKMTATSFLFNFLFFFVILIPPCIFMGGVFPLIIKIVSRGTILQIGTSVGNAYFANTLGAIAGSIIAGFIFIPLLGVHRSLKLLIMMNVSLGLFLLYLSRLKQEASAIVPVGGLLVAGVIAVATLSTGNVFLTVLKKQVYRQAGENELIYYKEAAAATVSVVEIKRNKVRILLVNSIVVAGESLTTKLMAHLPVLLHPDPRKALVICFGMGTTFRSLASHGLDVRGVELVPEEFETFPLFYDDAEQVLNNPRNKIEINDGRNHLLLTREKYDIITVDPSPPIYSSGTVNLYTPEFYRLCRDRLTPNGVMCMWFYLPSCHISEFQMLVKSFMTVFPHATIWQSPEIHGIFVIGTKEKLQLDRKNLRSRMQSRAIQDDLQEFIKKGLRFEESFLLDLFMFNHKRIWQLVEKGPDLSDDKPYIEHPLVTWWLDPSLLDVNKFYGMAKDDFRQYLIQTEH